MNDTYIKSVTISIPSQFVNWPSKSIRGLFNYWNWGTFCQYGNTSLLMIYINNFIYPIWFHIEYFLWHLKMNGILSPELTLNAIKIHEVKLRFEINFPHVIFCKTERFWKDNKTNTYYSDDHRYKKRKTKDRFSDEGDYLLESKGRQFSFLSVGHYEGGCSVILNFSGKYLKNIELAHLTWSNEELIDWLCNLGSIYLPKVTDTTVFKISLGFLPFIPVKLRTLLKKAHFLGGLCYEI